MKTHWKKLNNPNYLGAYSLMDGSGTAELTVTIDKVVMETVKSAREDQECVVAYLNGHKPMILNATNCKTIEKVLDTPFINDWAGQSITVYVAKIKAFGDNVDALRIRNVKPVIKLPELTPDSPKWAGAKKAIQSKSVTIEAIKKQYTISTTNEKELCKTSK